MKNPILLNAPLLIVLFSCQQSHHSPLQTPISPQERKAAWNHPQSPASENLTFIEEDILESETSELEGVENPSEPQDSEPAIEVPHIPIVQNIYVDKWIDYFTGKGRNHFQRYLNRGEIYRRRLEKILEDNGMPKELYYLALIESGFSNRARSRMGAVGLWQFIRGTGRRYDLHIQRRVDERQDPIRATTAASLYLRDLKNVFDSWFLAMSAYNAGEMRVLQAIMKANTRDFWQLVKKKQLPNETMNYVPKFMAARIIGSNPDKYGFHVKPEKSPLSTHWATIKVPSPINLKKLAKKTGVPLSSLKRNNPHLHKYNTPSQVRYYQLWVDPKNKPKIEAKLPELRKLAKSSPKKIQSEEEDIVFHRVRRGENLFLVSQRYGVSIRQLKTENGLSGSRIFIGQKLLIPNHRLFMKYRVRKGDSLSLISQKFGTSIRKLKRMNRLKKNRIYAGQLLKVGYRKG